MEGVMAMSNVDWTPENIKMAEKACKEAQQTVVIKTIDVSPKTHYKWLVLIKARKSEQRMQMVK